MCENFQLKAIKVIGLIVLAIAVSACAKAPEVANTSKDLFSYCLRIQQDHQEDGVSEQEWQAAISYCLEVKKLQEESEIILDGGGFEGDLDQESMFEVYDVHPLFAEFYDSLGGDKILGPAITPLFQSGELMRQYLRSGLMEFKYSATMSNRYRMVPLGLEMEVQEPPVPEPAIPGVRYVGGQVIYHEFLPLYERLGGSKIVGKPLTGVRHNPEKNRIEQYFENLGFFRLDFDEPGAARLLSYGSFVCGKSCNVQPPPANILSPEARLPDPFASTVANLGISFLGRNLTPAYIAPDGNEQVIFDNVVLAIDPDDPQQVRPQPIVQLLGIEPHPPFRCTEDPLMACYLVEEELGYNVPRVFVEYLDRYEWISLSGPPITGIYSIENGVFRQCFTNLCIDLEISELEGNRIALAPMGREYLQRFYTLEEPEGFIATQTLENVRIEVWESETYIPTDKPQQINVAIFEGSTPLANREPVLTVTMPDTRQRVYHFPPTSENGMSHITLLPIQAPNGTLIAYQVCLSSITGVQLCLTDHFLIWNYP